MCPCSYDGIEWSVAKTCVINMVLLFFCVVVSLRMLGLYIWWCLCFPSDARTSYLQRISRAKKRNTDTQNEKKVDIQRSVEICGRNISDAIFYRLVRFRLFLSLGSVPVSSWYFSNYFAISLRWIKLERFFVGSLSCLSNNNILLLLVLLALLFNSFLFWWLIVLLSFFLTPNGFRIGVDADAGPI